MNALTPAFIPEVIYYKSISDIGDFTIGISPIEGYFLRGWYSSAIGFFCIGKSPIGLPPFTPGNNARRVIFSLPSYADTFPLAPEPNQFVLPIPEGWAR